MDRPRNLKELDTTKQLPLSLSCCHEFYNPILTKQKEKYEELVKQLNLFSNSLISKTNEFNETLDKQTEQIEINKQKSVPIKAGHLR